MTASILGPYLSPEQAILLRYEGALPAALLAELGTFLRAELGALRALVPEALARDPAAFVRRSGSFWPGTMLCADLSGFTALAEALTAGGLIGLEELCAIINRVFGALLEEVYTYGGTVLKFGGDALTCLFDATELGPEHSAAACTAALAMQRRMAEFAALAAGGHTHRLRLRVGVHTGLPLGVIVGDAERSEVVVVGRAVNRLAMLQEQAEPGEVMISSETLAQLHGARSTRRASGHTLELLPPVAPTPAPPLPALPLENDLATLGELAAGVAALRPFLPNPVPRHVLFPERAIGGEFRPVSALFINVASLGGVLSLLEDLERPATAILNAYFSQVLQVVRRHGGELNKLDINSVGDKLLVTFGAPVAHEDDPLRAVESALDMGSAIEQANQQMREILDAERLKGAEGPTAEQAALRRTVDLALRQRIGVATGNVFAGSVGSPRRHEYTVIGQVVNLAARLMAAAEPGSVVVAPATARAVAGRIALKPLPPFTLKGFAQPVEASVVLGRSESPPASARAVAPLVGRERELELLRRLAPAALKASGRVVAISGEPGIGKSRLIRTFWDELRGRSSRRIALSGSAYAQHTPYSVIRDLLTQLFALPLDAAPEVLGTAIEGVVQSTAPVFAPLAPLLDTVFSLVAPAPDASSGVREPRSTFPLARLPQSERRERLHELVVALVVGALQHRPWRC